jgi:hypothetical protein
LAEKELETHLVADIWLSNKIQNALVSDYKDISDRYDRQLALDDMLTHGLIMQAVDKAIEQGQAPGKYYRNLDVYSIIRLQEASNQTMKNKLELISKGFLVYKIKRHIDHLRNQQKNTSDAGFKKILKVKKKQFKDIEGAPAICISDLSMTLTVPVRVFFRFEVSESTKLAKSFSG